MPRTAIVLAFLGIGLIGFVVGHWIAPAPSGAEQAITAPGHVSADRGAPRDTSMPVALGAATVLVLAAGWVMWRSSKTSCDTRLRDPLTNLFQSQYLDEVLPGWMARDDRANRSQLVLVRIGLDPVDEVRRRYGQSAGDRVLAIAARHIASQVRECDLPVAPDTHGFSVYLNCEEADQARAFCRRLVTLLHSEQLDWDGDAIKVSAHMGIAVRQLGEARPALDARARENLAAAAGGEPGQIVV